MHQYVTFANFFIVEFEIIWLTYTVQINSFHIQSPVNGWRWNMLNFAWLSWVKIRES